MDELYENQGHIRLYDRQLEGLVVKKSWRNEAGLNCLLIRDAYRGTQTKKFSAKCKALYDEGYICAEYSLQALMAKFEVSKPTILRWLDQLEADGLVKRRHDPSTQECSIYEVGYWERIRRQNGEFEHVHMYYCNEGGSNENMTTPSNENMTRGSHVSMTRGSHENMTQSHTTCSQTQQNTDATYQAVASLPPGNKPDLGKKSIKEVLNGSSEGLGLATSKTAEKIGKPKNAKTVIPTKYAQTKYMHAKEVLDLFRVLYREKLGAEYPEHARDIKNISNHMSENIGIETMSKVVEIYLDLFDKMEGHDGLPNVTRMLNQYRWDGLVYAAQTEDKSKIKLIVGGDYRVGHGSKETRKAIEEVW